MENSWDAWVSQTHAQTAAALRAWATTLNLDEAARAKLLFASEQWIAATHPDNFLATNQAALQRAVETKGQSLQSGMQLMLADLARGHVANTDESAFEVGRDLANTPGKVVMKNELIELIQYAPSTPKVGQRPLLIVPPCINKFYILDLGPANSFVQFAVAAGHTVFMVSWRNPKAGDTQVAQMGWDDYLQLGVVESLTAARAICKSDSVNALGFCVGGTILAAALAALAAKGEKPVASLTLLTTLLDFSHVGELGLFIDPASVAYRESTLGAGGLLSGKELAATFSALRPRDLIWNYVSNGYLKGEPPAAFDLLFWNADSTSLAGPMFCWYLRNLYLENRLRSGELESLGEPVNLGAIKVPAFIYASREDHIVPWQTAFESTRLLGGECRFVLGASGHIAGVVNPPHKKKRSHWSGSLANSARGTERKAANNGSGSHSADTWLGAAQETPGSWWPAWAAWLDAYKGMSVAARRTLGTVGTVGTAGAVGSTGNVGGKSNGKAGKYRPTVDAPGEYVKVRL